MKLNKPPLRAGMILMGLLASALSGAHQASPHQGISNDLYHYVLPQKVMQILSVSEKPQVIRSDAGFHLVRMSVNQAAHISAKIHEEIGGCGGLFEVENEVAARSESALELSSFAPQSGVLKAANLPSEPRYIQESQALITQVKEARFAEALRHLSSFSDRSGRSETGRSSVLWVKELVERLAREAGRPEIETKLVATGAAYLQESLVVRLPGQTRQPGVVIGGHIDTLSYGKPGVDDDGTGSVTALEVLRAILDQGAQFQRDIYFAFYAAEEVGLVGSSRVVQKFIQDGIAIRAVVHFDMTGFRSPSETMDLHFISDYTDLGLTNFAAQVATKTLGVPTEKIGRTACGYACSDHANWHRQGIPAVFPFESSFRNHNRLIHTPNDSMANISIEHAMRFVRLAAALVVELAEPKSTSTLVAN